MTIIISHFVNIITNILPVMLVITIFLDGREAKVNYRQPSCVVSSLCINSR